MEAVQICNRWTLVCVTIVTLGAMWAAVYLATHGQATSVAAFTGVATAAMGLLGGSVLHGQPSAPAPTAPINTAGGDATVNVTEGGDGGKQ